MNILFWSPSSCAACSCTVTYTQFTCACSHLLCPSPQHIQQEYRNMVPPRHCHHVATYTCHHSCASLYIQLLLSTTYLLKQCRVPLFNRTWSPPTTTIGKLGWFTIARNHCRMCLLRNPLLITSVEIASITAVDEHHPTNPTKEERKEYEWLQIKLISWCNFPCTHCPGLSLSQ